MKILVVDDYVTMRRIIRNLLSQIAHTDVEEAEDGNTAFDLLKRKKFDLVLSDWNMQPMSGLELLRKVRAEATLAPLPFIFVTAENKPENIAAAKQAGANNFVVKPFTAEVLRDRINLVMARATRNVA